MSAPSEVSDFEQPALQVGQSVLHVLQAGTDEALSQQLQALRQTCIPEVCFLLHSVLHSSSLFKKVSRCRYIMQGLKFNCF